MHIFLASDHAGFELKAALGAALAAAGHSIDDLGPATFDPADDYPLLMRPLSDAIVRTPDSFGIAIGKSGQGEAMALNRMPGVRTAVYYGGAPEILDLSRQHNDANILSLGAGFLSKDEALGAVLRWLSVPFAGDERHVRRIAELDAR